MCAFTTTLNILIPGKLVNTSPCQYLLSFPFYSSSVTTCGQIGGLGSIYAIRYSYVSLLSRALIHQFPRYAMYLNSYHFGASNIGRRILHRQYAGLIQGRHRVCSGSGQGCLQCYPHILFLTLWKFRRKAPIYGGL